MPRRKGYDAYERTVVVQVIEKRKGQRKPILREMRFTEKDPDTTETRSSPDVFALAEQFFKKSDPHHKVLEHRKDRK